jgi:hypothetical protein
VQVRVETDAHGVLQGIDGSGRAGQGSAAGEVAEPLDGRLAAVLILRPYSRVCRQD